MTASGQLEAVKRGRTGAVRRCAQILHILLEMTVGIAVISLIGAGVLAWRLSQGPLDIAWLARRLEVAADRDTHGTQLRIGHAYLVWEGWQRGVDQPLDIRLQNTTAVAPDGAVIAAIPSARVALSPGWLLLGRLVPRIIDMDGARLRVLRAADGSVSLDLGTLTDSGDEAAAPPAQRPPSPFDRLLTDLARPPQNDRSAFGPGFVPVSQLRQVRIHDARVVVVDRQLGAVWSAPKAEIDLQRDAAGGVSGVAEVSLELGQEHAQLSVHGSLAAGGSQTRVEVHLTPISPAALARGAVGLARLADLDAPLTLAANATFGPHLAPGTWSVRASLGAGHVHLADADVPLRQASLTWSGDALNAGSAAATLVLPAAGHDATLQLKARLLPAAPGTPPGRVVQASGTLDQLSFADLATFWPAPIARDARNWVVENIPAGLAHDGHVELTLGLPADHPDNPQLTALSGSVQGDNVTVFWLRPVPSIDHGQATLTLDGPDAMTIAVHAGQTGNLTTHSASVHITGLSHKDQDLAIAGLIDGPVPDVVALLRQKRLHLFDRHPFDLRDPSGSSSTQLTVSLPLRHDLTMEMVNIQAHSAVKNLHLTGLVAGRDIDQGQLDLAVNQEGLQVKGTAQIAHMPADLTGGLDFRDGPASQVVQHAEASLQGNDQQLVAAGLDPLGLVSGVVDLTAQWQQRRNGQAEVTAHADLQPAALTASSVGWSKPAGAAATFDAHLVLNGSRLVAVDRLQAQGPDLMIRGHAGDFDGQGSTLVIDQALLGRSRMQGWVSFPARADQPIRAQVDGPLLDLSARLSRHPVNGVPAPPQPPVTSRPVSKGPPWIVDATFARVLMAHDDALATVRLHVENDGLLLQRASLQTADAGSLTLEPSANGRHLTGQSANAGALLRALDIVRDMQGGRLQLDAHYDDRADDHPLVGSAEITDFRLRNAPALARLLQAMTLYGLVDLVQGPGLGFTRLVAPFRLVGNRLELESARAYSSSLGLTAKGQFDLAQNTVDVQGTIVPAYFFNSLLGGLPLVGQLFSPEKGGGLFAATYGLNGSLADPSVRVNPLAALTPGFLRGVFD